MMGTFNEVQKSRLRTAGEASLDAYRLMYDGLIEQVSNNDAYARSDDAGRANGAFYRLLARQGLVVGDVVRVLVKGPFTGVEVEVREFDHANRVELRVDGVDVVVRATEVELITPSPEG